MLPDEALTRAKKLSIQIKTYVQQRRTQFTSDTNADVVLAVFHDLRRFRDDLAQIKTVDGIAEHARTQENDASYDVVAEFNALASAVESLMNLIQTTFPVDGSGYLLEKQWAGDGTYTFRQFTANQLSATRAAMDTVIAAID